MKVDFDCYFKSQNRDFGGGGKEMKVALFWKLCGHGCLC